MQLYTDDGTLIEVPSKHKVRVHVVAVPRDGSFRNMWISNPNTSDEGAKVAGGVFAGHRIPLSGNPQETWFETDENGRFGFQVLYDDTGMHWNHLPDEARGLGDFLNVRFLMRVEGAEERKGDGERVKSQGGCVFYIEGNQWESDHGIVQLEGDDDLWPTNAETFDPPFRHPPQHRELLPEPWFDGYDACEPLTTDADTDMDGWPDPLDVCPNDPNKSASPGVCGCGADDSLDTDGDGTVDCLDACPTSSFTATGPCVSWGDADADGDVDQDDFGALQRCIAGDVSEVTPDCRRWDFDHDGQIRVSVEGEKFIQCFSGPTMAATACLSGV